MSGDILLSQPCIQVKCNDSELRNANDKWEQRAIVSRPVPHAAALDFVNSTQRPAINMKMKKITMTIIPCYVCTTVLSNSTIRGFDWESVRHIPSGFNA